MDFGTPAAFVVAVGLSSPIVAGGIWLAIAGLRRGTPRIFEAGKRKKKRREELCFMGADVERRAAAALMAYLARGWRLVEAMEWTENGRIRKLILRVRPPLTRAYESHSVHCPRFMQGALLSWGVGKGECTCQGMSEG